MTASIKKLAIRSVAFNWLARGCSFVITFVVTPILLHALGNEQYGLWSMVIAFTSYYSIANLGFRSAGTKFIAEYHAVGEREMIAKVLTVSAVTCGCIALGVWLLILPVAWGVPFLFDTTTDLATIRIAVLLTGTAACVRIVGQPFAAVLGALKRFDISNVIVTVAAIVRAASVITVVKLGGGLAEMAACALCVALAAQLTTAFVAIRLLGGVSFSRAAWDAGMLRKLFGYGGLSLISGFSRRLQQSGGGLVVGFLLGPAMVPFFSLAEDLIGKARGLSIDVNSVIMPMASRLQAQQKLADIRQMFMLSSRALLLMCLTIAGVFFVFGRQLYDLWIGPGYADSSYPVLCILAVAFVVRSPMSAARSILKGTTEIQFVAKLAAADAIATLCLAVLLVNTTGVMGAAWAVLAVQVISSGIILPWYTFRLLDIHPWKWAQESLLPAVAGTAPTALVAVLLSRMMAPESMLHLVLEVAMAGVVAAMSGYFMCFDPQMRVTIRSALVGRGTR